MKLGVFLPTFRDNAHDALNAALEAERAGLDGVFAYDHLWPMGSPTRPALAPFPVLAAVASRCASLVVGPLVARVALVGTTKLVEQFMTLESLAPGRVIAALGTGDKLSRDEQIGFGLGYPPAEQRWKLLDDAVVELSGRVPVWCGAGLASTDRVARSHGVTLNLWDASAKRVLEESTKGPVSWAGPIKDDVEGTLDALASAGATWAVVATPIPIAELENWRRSH